MSSNWYRWQDDVLLLECYLKPRAKSDNVLGLHNGRLHVQVKAPAVDGKANAALCNFMAAAFGTSRKQALLRKGDTARFKTVAIEQPRHQPGWFTELSRQ